MRRCRCGISDAPVAVARGLLLLLITFSCALANTAAVAAEPDALRSVRSSESASPSEVQESNLERMNIHGDIKDGRRRREAVSASDDEADAKASEGERDRRSDSGDAGNQDRKAQSRALLTEYTMNEESSLTVVSRALEALANKTRQAAAGTEQEKDTAANGGSDRSAIATNVFVIEGDSDSDSVKSILNSRPASVALARSEADALRKVMAMIMEPGDAAKDSGSATVVRTRFGRSAANPEAPIKPSRRNRIHHGQRHDRGKARENRIDTGRSRIVDSDMFKRKSIVYHDVGERATRMKAGISEDDDEEEEEETPRAKYVVRNKGYRKPQRKDEDEEEEDDDHYAPRPRIKDLATNRRAKQDWRSMDSFAARSGLRQAYPETEEHYGDMRYGYGGFSSRFDTGPERRMFS